MGTYEVGQESFDVRKRTPRVGKGTELMVVIQLDGGYPTVVGL